MLVRAVFLLALASFASTLSLRAADPLLPMLADSFGILPGAASISITSFGIGYGVFQILHGAVGDRIGKFQLMIVLTALSAVGSFACALAPGLPTLLAARFFTGAMTGGIIPLSMAWIGDTVPYEKRQAFIARYMLGNFLGMALGPLTGGYLAEAWGWRMPFHVIGVIYLFITGVFWFEMRANALTRKPEPAGSSLLDVFRGMWRLLDDYWVRVILFTVMFSGAFLFAPVSFVPLHAQFRFGIGPGESSMILIAYAAGSMAFAFGSGQLVRMLGERGLLLWGSVLLMAGWPVYAMAPNPTVALLPVFLAGLGTFAVHNTIQVHATQMAPHARGSAMALFAASLFIGQSLAVGVWGAIVDRFGTTPIFLTCAFGAASMALVFRRSVKRRRS